MQMKQIVMETCDEAFFFFFFFNKREEGLPVRRLLVMVEQGVHSEASEIGEFSVYSTEFYGYRSVSYDYYVFSRGAFFKIFSCNVTPFSCHQNS